MHSKHNSTSTMRAHHMYERPTNVQHSLYKRNAKPEGPSTDMKNVNSSNALAMAPS